MMKKSEKKRPSESLLYYCLSSSHENKERVHVMISKKEGKKKFFIQSVNQSLQTIFSHETQSRNREKRTNDKTTIGKKKGEVKNRREKIRQSMIIQSTRVKSISAEHSLVFYEMVSGET